MTRFPVPLRVAAVPALLSLLLSLSTVGDKPFWQDSGGYLVAVKELGVLYPPGFVVYLLLSKAWTLVFFFVDFTLAVHLFSSACAAAAAGIIALAARAWLRSSGPVFGLAAGDPGPRSDWAAAAAGCLAACGYTYWFAGIYAKGYSLFYLVLALILWRMIRADEARRPQDLTILAALFGLAWAVHPAAALLGPAFLLFVVSQRRSIGLPGIAWRTGLAALLALGPALALPLLSAREPWLMMGNPRTFGDLLEYVLGRRFTELPGVFGYSSSRFASFSLYFWEEFLVVGTALVVAGLARIATARPWLLAGLAAWIVPYSLVTLLFKIEGQHDCWLVAAWIPLHLVAARGLDWIAARAGRRAIPAIAATVLVGVSWAAILNRPLLNQRGYTLADDFARAHLDNLDEGAILLMEGDDVVFLCSYAQRVARRRPDLVLVWLSLLDSGNQGRNSWYDRKLLAAHPSLKLPAYEDLRSRFPDLGRFDLLKGAFIEANARRGRPIFLQGIFPEKLLPPGCSMVPAGGLWKVEPGLGGRIEARYWEMPLQPEEVRRAYRRERGQTLIYGRDRIDVRPECYERRLVMFLLGARLNLADLQLNRANWVEAAAAYESILTLDDGYRRDAETLFALAVAYRGMGREPEAERVLRVALRHASTPVRTAESLFALGEIYRKRGDESRAVACMQDALRVPDLPPEDRSRLQARMKSP